jgi:hypothetical protein
MFGITKMVLGDGVDLASFPVSASIRGPVLLNVARAWRRDSRRLGVARPSLRDLRLLSVHVPPCAISSQAWALRRSCDRRPRRIQQRPLHLRGTRWCGGVFVFVRIFSFGMAWVVCGYPGCLFAWNRAHS